MRPETKRKKISRHVAGGLMVATLLVVLTTAAAADVYMYMDSQGVMHFTDSPTSANYTLHFKTRPQRQAEATGASRFDPLIAEAAERHGLAFGLLKALIKVESDFNPKAVSKTGALGLMQIMPKNVRAFDIRDPFDPHQNIMGGSRYLSRLLERFEGQLPLALAAYNAGPTVVDRYRRIPPIAETENFVQRVMDYYHAYQRRAAE